MTFSDNSSYFCLPRNRFVIKILLMKGNKDRKRRFFSGECIHIYQKSVNGFILFYETEDILACYTMISVYSRIHNVKILELCFMVDHIHILITADKPEAMAALMRDFSSAYVLNFNSSIGRSGQLLHKSYGNAPKRGDKKVRSAIIYIGNNPVEKKICKRAEEYRWNFMPYILKPFPYSEKRTLRHMENSIRKLCKEIQECRNKNEYLTHDRLHRMFCGLSDRDKEFLTDFIIMKFWFLDESTMTSYFMDIKSMTEAMASTTGSEYEIHESFNPEPDTAYHEMASVIKKSFPGIPVRRIITLPAEQKIKVFSFLKQTSSASFSQICRFLHIEQKRSRSQTPQHQDITPTPCCNAQQGVEIKH